MQIFVRPRDLSWGSERGPGWSLGLVFSRLSDTVIYNKWIMQQRLNKSKTKKENDDTQFTRSIFYILKQSKKD